MMKSVSFVEVLKIICILLCNVNVVPVESFSITTGRGGKAVMSEANIAPMRMSSSGTKSSFHLYATKDSDPWGDDEDDDDETTASSISTATTTAVASTTTSIEETNDYPINAPSPILLASSMVLAIASTGSVFELAGGSPVLGFLPTAGIAIVGIPLCFFLFYAAIKKGMAETEEDDKNYRNQRNSNSF